MEHWTEDATARDRVEAVALTLRQPRSVNWIREQAEVGSWETVKSHLDRLVEAGRLRTVEVDGDARYAVDPVRAYLDHVGDLVREHSKAELRDELEAIADDVEDRKQKYGVESFEELEASLGDDDRAPGEIRKRRRAVSRWEADRRSRELLTHALRLYDDLAAQARTSTDGAANHAD